MRESISDQYGRAIGYVEDGIFYTTRTRSIHLFRLFQSYGISVYVLDKLRHRGVTHVQITERLTPGERVLLSKIDLWLSSGKRYVDRGQDEQRHLPIAEMSVI